MSTKLGLYLHFANNSQVWIFHFQEEKKKLHYNKTYTCLNHAIYYAHVYIHNIYIIYTNAIHALYVCYKDNQNENLMYNLVTIFDYTMLHICACFVIYRTIKFAKRGELKCSHTYTHTHTQITGHGCVH